MAFGSISHGVFETGVANEFAHDVDYVPLENNVHAPVRPFTNIDSVDIPPGAVR